MGFERKFKRNLQRLMEQFEMWNIVGGKRSEFKLFVKNDILWKKRGKSF